MRISSGPFVPFCTTRPEGEPACKPNVAVCGYPLECKAGRCVLDAAPDAGHSDADVTDP